MAQDSLKRTALAGAVVALGLGFELAAHAAVPWALLDLAVGCTAGVWGAALVGRSRSGPLALAFAVLWFCGTLWSGVLALTYRGPLLHLLLLAGPRRRLATGVAAAGWVAALLPFNIASPLTCAIAAVAAAVLLRPVRLAALDTRSGAFASGLAALALAITWCLGALAVGRATLLLAVNDVVVLASVVVALAAAAGFFAREAERSLVIDLGPTGRPGLPLTTRLARALADPDLDVRYLVPDVGWVDERGRPVAPPPDSGRRTRVAAPGGGEIVLLHGRDATADSRLAQSAASAAALSLETARLDAEVRLRAGDVKASRSRLLGAVDAERQALEQRLSQRVLVRLRAVDRLLAGHALESERRHLRTAVEELVALGRGLYPPSLARADLRKALRELADRSGIAVTTEVVGEPATLSEPQRAAVWFVCSEALTNITRHACARSAMIRLHVTDRLSVLEVADDGRGGATLERGLRGLADRVEALGGELELSSPPGGPTVLRVELPAV